MEKYNPNWQEDIQSQRDNLASRLKVIRKDRDESRSNAKKPLTRIKSMIGLGSEASLANSKADSLHKDARALLNQGRKWIADRQKSYEEIEENQKYQEMSEEIGRLEHSLSTGAENEVLSKQVSSFLNHKLYLSQQIQNPKLYGSVLSKIISLRSLAENVKDRSAYDKSLQSHAGSIRQFVDNLVYEEMGVVESHLSEMTKDVRVSMNAVSMLLGNMNIPDHHKILNLAIKYIGIIKDGLLGQAFFSNYLSAHFLDRVSQAGWKGEQVVIEMITDLVDNEGNGINHIWEVLCILAYSENSTLKSTSEDYIKKFAEKYGIDGEKALSRWKQDGHDVQGIPFENLKALQNLETKQPGCPALLQKEFGIYCFGRYPEQMLLDQYAQYGDLEIPYGCMIQSAADHNGAFSIRVPVWDKFYGQIRGRFAVRIFEVETSTGIAKALLKLDKKYSVKGQNKICFGILCGHGSQNRVLLSQSSAGKAFMVGEEWVDTSILNPRAFSGSGTNRLKDFFRPDANLVFFSCSTGVSDGIAQKLSEKLGLRVIAPSEDCNIHSLSAETTNSGNLNFTVSYGRAGIDKDYKAGILEKN